MRVSDIVKKKGTSVVTLPPSASIADLLSALAEHRIGAVVVMDGDEISGIVSERDVVRHLRDSVDVTVPVAEIMTTELAWCAMRERLSASSWRTVSCWRSCRAATS